MLVLDLIRHGEAEPAGPGGDRARLLTAAGERSIRRLCGRLETPPERIFSSPLARAQQTALVLVRDLRLERRVEVLEELGPGHPPETVIEALAGLGITAGHVALVGHQPQMGQLVAYLTGRVGGFAAGQLVRVSCPEGAGPRAGTIGLALHPEDQRG